MPLEREITAYEKQREELERLYAGKYALFHDDEMIGVFDALDDAAREAIRRFGQGPYLIRPIGLPPSAATAAVLHLISQT